MILRERSQDRPTYRPDIDGLRALAIVPVVAFHYGCNGVPGGFTGVDVFFVISGFLIASLLMSDMARGQFSVLSFYERRVRRILPALFFMLAVASAVALILLMPLDLQNFGKSVIATAAFSSNFLFWHGVGYFDRAQEFKPLLHTWSLAVEEQFYIFFPLGLWLLARFAARYLRTLLVMALAVSMGVSVLSAYSRPEFGFYLLPARGWELLTGAVLAAGVPPLRSRLARDAISLAGIGLIVGSVLFITHAMPFPGWVAAFPCLGAALVIHASVSGGGVGNDVLALRPLVFIGLISYSLYLWHWPVFVFAKYAANRNLTLGETGLVCVAAVTMAIVSWRYVERPFRGAASAVGGAGLFSGAIVATVATVAIGAGFIATRGLPARFSSDVVRYVTNAGIESRVAAACFNVSAGDVRAEKLCRLGAPGDGAPGFLLWGDSHAFRMAVPVGETAASRGRSGLLAATGSCPPLLNVETRQAECGAFNRAVAGLLTERRFGTVVLSANWANYAEGSSFGDEAAKRAFNPLADAGSQEQSVEENRRVFERALRRTIAQIMDGGARVVVIGPVPEIGVPVPETLARAQRYGGSKDIGPTRAQYLERQRHVQRVLASVTRAPDVTVVYPADALCSETCAVEAAGSALYIDDNHLSLTGLEKVRGVFDPVFEPRQGALP